MHNLLATLETLRRELDASAAVAEMMLYLSWQPGFIEPWMTLYPTDIAAPDVLNVRLGWAVDGKSFCIDLPLTATVQLAAA